MINFQIFNCFESDGDLNEINEVDRLNENNTGQRNYLQITDTSRYTLSLFGRCADGKSVTAHIKGFKPYHVIRFNSSKTDVQHSLNLIESKIKEKMKGRIDGEWRSLEDHLTIEGPVQLVSNYGFRNNETDDLYYFKCKSLWAYNKLNGLLVSMMEDFDFKMVHKMAPLLRFFCDHKDFKPAGWYSVNDKYILPPELRQTSRDIELLVPYKKLKYLDLDTVVQPKEACFDIEVLSVDRSFPNAKRPTDVCFAIGLSIHYGNETEKYLFYQPIKPDVFEDNVNLIHCKDEKDLLIRFSNILRNKDVDVIVGYNSDQFDFNYIYERADLLCISDTFSKLSCVNGLKTFIKDESFQSSARGDSRFRRPQIPGLLAIDSLILILSDVTKRYKTYSLRNVAQNVLGETKDDLEALEMFKKFLTMDTSEASIVAKYCMRDVDVTYKVYKALNQLVGCIVTSNLNHVIPIYLISRGQTVKVHCSLYRRGLQMGYYFDNINEMSPHDEKQGGGHVKAPVPGFYPDPTTILDFKSLYPSIMLGYCMEWSTIVREDKFSKVEGIEYFDYEGENPTSRRCIKEKYAQVKGPLSVELRHLWDSRQADKKEISRINKEIKELKEKGLEIPKEYNLKISILSASEQAKKVSMNSFYGQCNSRKFPICNLAESITGQGRQNLIKCEKFADNELKDLSVSKGIITKEEADSIEINTRYGDTDSIFVNMKGATEKISDKIGYLAEKHLTDVVFNRPPVEMEFEKTFIQMLLFNKKKIYIYSMRDKFGKLKIGFQGGKISKRDTVDYFKIVFKKIVNRVFIKQEPEGYPGCNINDYGFSNYTGPLVDVPDGSPKAIDEALIIAKTCLEELFYGNIDIEQLAYTKKLKGTYTSPTLKNNKGEKLSVGAYDEREGAIPNVPHVQLANRIKSRNPGSEPSIGARFSMTNAINPYKKDEKSEQVETIEFIKENGLEIDKVTLLNSHFDTIVDFFTLLGKEREIKSIFETLIKYETNRINTMLSVMRIKSSHQNGGPILFEKRKVKYRWKQALGDTQSLLKFFKKL